MTIIYDQAIEYDTGIYTYDGTAVSFIAINGIHGQSFADGTEELIVVWNTRPVIYDSTMGWSHQPVTLTTSTDVYFDSFLNHVFMVNYINPNYSYNGTTWSTTTNLTDSPYAQFVKEHRTRLYLYKIKIGGAIIKPSWVWFSDFPKNGQITWGLEYGTDLVQTGSSAIVTSATATFITNNVKIGDSLVIVDGDNAGEYYIQSVDSETQITLTEELTNNDNSNTYWAGGNYFEVSTEDGDMGMGMAETSNELFCFKKSSLYRYNSIAKELRKVKTAPGTSSPRSIIESSNYIYWYHPSGIYRTQGVEEELISNAIEDVIEGVDSNIRDKVCGWRNEKKKLVKWYLGNTTLRDGRVIEKCVATFDENSQSWSLGSIDTEIKVACNWLESNIPKVYVGDYIRTVYEIETGTDFNGSAIPFEMEMKPIFPVSTETTVTFTRVRAYIEQSSNIRILYKLMYKPGKRERNWTNDLDWKPLKGIQSGEKSEWLFPNNARASGVKLKVVESSTKESFLLEKLVVYYSNPLDE